MMNNLEVELIVANETIREAEEALNNYTMIIKYCENMQIN